MVADRFGTVFAARCLIVAIFLYIINSNQFYAVRELQENKEKIS